MKVGEEYDDGSGWLGGFLEAETGRLMEKDAIETAQRLETLKLLEALAAGAKATRETTNLLKALSDPDVLMSLVGVQARIGGYVSTEKKGKNK